MHLEYSPDEGLLYLRLKSGEVSETIEVGKAIYADLDAEGQAIGIEALDATEFFAFLANNAESTDGRIVVDLPDGLNQLVRTARKVPAA